MTQDIATYERKATRYLDALANEAEKDCNENEESGTIQLPDTLDFWIKQVLKIRSLFTE